jgi:hypothetical protein
MCPPASSPFGCHGTRGPAMNEIADASTKVVTGRSRKETLG